MKKIFIWDNVEKCTDNYHCGGGVVVIARGEITARKLANSIDECEIKDDEKPIKILKLAEEYKDDVFIFPNAGCC